MRTDQGRRPGLVDTRQEASHPVIMLVIVIFVIVIVVIIIVIITLAYSRQEAPHPVINVCHRYHHCHYRHCHRHYVIII